MSEVSDIWLGVILGGAAGTIDLQERVIASKQARIDALMLEFCEEEMTSAQMDNWESHQVVSEYKGSER